MAGTDTFADKLKALDDDAFDKVVEGIGREKRERAERAAEARRQKLDPELEKRLDNAGDLSDLEMEQLVKDTARG